MASWVHFAVFAFDFFRGAVYDLSISCLCVSQGTNCTTTVSFPMFLVRVPHDASGKSSLAVDLKCRNVVLLIRLGVVILFSVSSTLPDVP